MTVIVVRGNLLATDSGLWEGESLITDEWQKVFRCRHGVLAAFNYPGYTEAAIKAMNEADTIPDRLDLGHETDIIFLGNDGVIRHYKENYMFRTQLPFWAIGPASPAAYGALHMGADAATACEIAIKVGPWAAGKVQCMSVSGEAQSASEPEEDFDPASINPFETYAEGDDTPMWKRERGL